MKDKDEVIQNDAIKYLYEKKNMIKMKKNDTINLNTHICVKHKYMKKNI